MKGCWVRRDGRSGGTRSASRMPAPRFNLGEEREHANLRNGTTAVDQRGGRNSFGETDELKSEVSRERNQVDTATRGMLPQAWRRCLK
eukprot:2123704-Alexandrium_andersonii.AAC.1